MKEQKIIVQENLSNQNNEINKINHFIQAVNKVIAKFNADTGYTLTVQEVGMLISNGTDAVATIHERVKVHSNKKLDDLQIEGEMMRSSFLSALSKFINQVAKEINAFHGSPGAQYLNDLVMTDGKLVLPEEAEKSIRESFMNIISSDKAKQLFNLQKEAAGSLQKLLQFVNAETHLHFANLNSLTGNFFQLENNSVEITDIGYEKLVKKIFA